MSRISRRRIFPVVAAAATLGMAAQAVAYPPGVGTTTRSRSCAACHESNGPWRDEARTVIEILDAKTKQPLRGPDGALTITVVRGESRTVLTVIGRAAGERTPPRRNAWLYVDPAQIETASLSKFAPGWDVDLPMSCRIVGDRLAGHEGAHLTVLPMTVRPTDAARDADVELQIMITAGEAVKEKGKEGMIANLYTRQVRLRVREPGESHR